MKKTRIKLMKKIYPIIWSGIIVGAIYLLIRFSTLSFSDKIGQADSSLQDMIFSSICSKAIEDGASLISYTENKEQYSLPVVFAADNFALQNYTDDNSVLASSESDEYASLFDEKPSDVNASGVNASGSTGEAIEAMNTGGIQSSMNLYEIPDQYLSKEYILTNGAIYNSTMAANQMAEGGTDQLQIGYEKGDVYFETEDNASNDSSSMEAVNSDGLVDYTMDQLKDTSFLVRNFYIVDSSTKITEQLFDAKKLINANMKIKQGNDKPQILIYHTHSQEGYIDSKSGKKEDTVVGVGDYLTKILEDDYGYNVIHDTTTYDIVNGSLNRNVAYNKAEAGLEKILKKNPSIEVVIDLHRDGGPARTIKIDGKETAKIMLFNGLSRDQDGPITYLYNPNLQDNLAFSFQLQMKSHQLYPGLFTKNYLKSYRYNMNIRPKSLLVELGTDKNTVESAKNAMVPFAKVLDSILKGK